MRLDLIVSWAAFVRVYACRVKLYHGLPRQDDDRGENAMLLTQLEEHGLHSELQRRGSRNKGTLLFHVEIFNAFTTSLSPLLFQTVQTLKLQASTSRIEISTFDHF